MPVVTVTRSADHLLEDRLLIVLVGLFIRLGHHADPDEPARLAGRVGHGEGGLARHLALEDQSSS